MIYKKYMRDNPEVFKDSDMNFIYDRIHAVVQKQINFLLNVGYN